MASVPVQIHREATNCVQAVIGFDKPKAEQGYATDFCCRNRRRDESIIYKEKNSWHQAPPNQLSAGLTPLCGCWQLRFFQATVKL